MSSLILTMPRLTGARRSATELTKSLPDDLSQTEITVKANSMEAASQGFADQLITELFDNRNAKRLVIAQPTLRFAGHLMAAAALRGIDHKVDLIS